MNEINDDAIMKALGRQMGVAVAKQVVSSGNLANLDTPSYRTLDVAFDDLLAQELGKSELAATNEKHMASPARDSACVTGARVVGDPNRRRSRGRGHGNGTIDVGRVTPGGRRRLV